MITTTRKTKELLTTLTVRQSPHKTKASVRGRGIAISGEDLKRLMRQSGVTPLDIWDNHEIPVADMRHYCSTGLQGFQAVEVIYFITGVWIE